MSIRIFLSAVFVLSIAMTVFADTSRLAIVPGGDPKPVELLTLAEAKLFEWDGIELVERNEIDTILAEQKLSGFFGAENALQLGKVFRADLFAVLEPMSIVVFDARTGLRYADETLPEDMEKAVLIVADAVKLSLEKRRNLSNRTLETYGILEIRNADFTTDRDAWCKAVAGMLERQLLRSGAAVLERSRLGQINRERHLTGDDSNDLLASMKLIGLEFKRGKEPKTFRLTARIGDKTFHAESPNDKPMDAVRELARKLLDTEAPGAVPDEAARFARESEFYSRYEKHEDALEKAESALALEPTNLRYRMNIVRIIGDWNSSEIWPRRAGQEEIFSGPEAEEAFRRLLQRARRAEELAYPSPSGNIDYTYRILVLRSRDHLMEIAREHHPDFLPELREINRRVMRRWLENSYQPALSRVVDARTAQEYFDVARCIIEVDYGSQEPEELFELFAVVIADTLKHMQKYPPDGKDETTDSTVWSVYKRLVDLFQDFAGQTVGYRQRYKDHPNEKVDTMIARIITLMENSDDFLVQQYAWIAANKPCGNRLHEKPEPERQAMADYTEKLRHRIAGFSRDPSLVAVGFLYEELLSCSVLPYSFNTQSNSRLASYDVILTLADTRNDYVGQSFLSSFIGDVKKISDSPQTDKDKSCLLEAKPRFQAMVSKQLKFVEKYRIKDFERLREKAVYAGLLEEKPTPIRPWKDEITLIGADGPRHLGGQLSGSSDLPILRGDTLYFKLRNEGRFFLGELDFSGDGTKTPELRCRIELQHDGVMAYVDDRNVYFRNQGLRVHPLDGSEPWRLGEEDGLPSNGFFIYGTLGDFLYGCVGDDWIVRVDLNTKAFEILSSSKAKEGKTPFVNGFRPPFTGAMDDPKRNRILLFHRRGELWTLDGNSGDFVRINDVRGSGPVRPICLTADGDTLLLNFFISVCIVDLKKSWDENAGKSVGSPEAICFTEGIPCDIYTAAERDGFLYGTISTGYSNGWNRLALDGRSKTEPLETPELFREAEKNNFNRWWPGCIFSLPGDKGLIVGNGYPRKLVYLRFESGQAGKNKP